MPPPPPPPLPPPPPTFPSGHHRLCRTAMTPEEGKALGKITSAPFPSKTDTHVDIGKHIHYGVQCDECRMYPIRGDRYKCRKCPNYDLCGGCYEKQVHKKHKMKRKALKFCTKDHLLTKIESRNYYNCKSCQRYITNQQSYHCNECDDTFCFECKEDKNAEKNGCFSKSSKNKAIKLVLTSCFLDFLRRLFPMFQATWVQMDVLSDARQTWTYYAHANLNGSYANWARKIMQKNNSANFYTLSSGYYYTAIFVWFFTPTILASFYMIKARKPLATFKLIFDDRHYIKYNDNRYYKALFAVFLFPIDFICAALVIYLMIPYSSFRKAYKILRRRELTHEDRIVTIGDLPIVSGFLPFWKGFEFIGEALPQLLLSIVFMVNNYDFMTQTDTMIGVNELTVTLISTMFSIGSIAMGLYAAIPMFIDSFS